MKYKSNLRWQNEIQVFCFTAEIQANDTKAGKPIHPREQVIQISALRNQRKEMGIYVNL